MVDEEEFTDVMIDKIRDMFSKMSKPELIDFIIDYVPHDELEKIVMMEDLPEEQKEMADDFLYCKTHAEVAMMLISANLKKTNNKEDE